MSKILEFFRNKNLERKFSRLGEGNKLGDKSSDEKSTKVSQPISQPQRKLHNEFPTSSSLAASAAIERQNQRNKKPGRPLRDQVRREVEQERKSEEESAALKERFTPKVIMQDKPAALARVLFWCPSLLGDSVVGSREEVDQAIDQYLQSESVQNLPEAATLMVARHLQLCKIPVLTDVPISEQPTASEWREKRKQNLARILNNLIENPHNPTFRRLRVGNPLIGGLLSIQGVELFFTACHFVRQSLPAVKPTQDDTQLEGETEPECESFLVISEEDATNTDHLKHMLELLNTAEPILAELYRDTKVYAICGTSSGMPSREQLPDDYFCLSRDEVKRQLEQQQRIVEESGMLLTKAMRERLRIQEVRLFRYALIRVRLPGNLVIQGTFYASDTLATVRVWISECLAVPSTEYQLWAPPGTINAGRSNAPLTARVELTNETTTLIECGLAPCSLLTLSIPSSSSSTSPGSGTSSPPPSSQPLLRPDLLSNICSL